MNTLLPLLILAIPVACVAWTVTHEELFRELHEYCLTRSKRSNSFIAKKLYYLFTCEYCFSHYVTIALLFMTQYTLLFSGWRGYIIAFFSIVFIANVYMSLFSKIKVDVRKERLEIKQLEETL